MKVERYYPFSLIRIDGPIIMSSHISQADFAKMLLPPEKHDVLDLPAGLVSGRQS